MFLFIEKTKLSDRRDDFSNESVYLYFPTVSLRCKIESVRLRNQRQLEIFKCIVLQFDNLIQFLGISPDQTWRKSRRGVDMKESTRVREKLGGGYSGIGSVEVAGEILMQLAKFRHPTSLKALSDMCRLTPSKVHRYLSSLSKLGLVFQGAKSGNYSLGRNTILIGLAAMRQNDQIDEVIEQLPELAGKAKSHCFLTVWSKAGPTIIKWERSDDSLVIGLPLGQVLPVSHSASGHVFAAHLGAAITRDLLAQEGFPMATSRFALMRICRPF
jgi:hypothetical protein